MNLLENYLTYLNEKEYDLGVARDTSKRGIKNLFRGAAKRDAAGKVIKNTTKSAGKFIAHNAKYGAKSSLWFSLVITLGLGTAWKGLTFAFSQAHRKCGFSKGPGKQMCLARERIKILQQKLVMMNKMMSACNKTKDPASCKQQGQLEIDKVKNRIESNQNKLKAAMNTEESIDVNEQMALTGVAASVVAGFAMDFAMQKAWRTALAVFSQASRKCGVYKTGPERNLCMSQYKLISLNKQLMILNQMQSKCVSQKNPENCKLKVGKKLENIQRQMQIQKDNITVYKKDVEVEKREQEMKKAKKLAAKGL